MRLLPKHRVGFLNGFARDGFLRAAAHGCPIRCGTLSGRRRRARSGDRRMSKRGKGAEGDPEPSDRQRPDGLAQAIRPPSESLYSTTAANHESGKKDE